MEFSWSTTVRRWELSTQRKWWWLCLCSTCSWYSSHHLDPLSLPDSASGQGGQIGHGAPQWSGKATFLVWSSFSFQCELSSEFSTGSSDRLVHLGVHDHRALLRLLEGNWAEVSQHLPAHLLFASDGVVCSQSLLFCLWCHQLILYYLLFWFIKGHLSQNILKIHMKISRIVDNKSTTCKN